MVGGKIIKVCGMREGENIRGVESLQGIDYMGFIFFAKSPRNVTRLPDYMPTRAKRVGVFVNESEAVIVLRIKEFGLDAVQLHGSERPQFCDSIRRLGVELFKAISVSCVADVAVAEQYTGHCDLLIFDTKCDGHGGSGEQFEWSILQSYRGETPFLLSGGISLESVAGLREFSHPRLAGYDVNSRFESEPAMKNVALVEQFISELNE